jgi:hypothetical protein
MSEGGGSPEGGSQLMEVWEGKEGVSATLHIQNLRHENHNKFFQ